MRYLPTCTALPPHYKYNHSSCRAATLLHFSPVEKNMLKVPLKGVYKLWSHCRKWASREKWICIFHYHHPFLAGVTRKYLDRMYVISLGRNWLSWNPEKILPLGRRNQSCRNSQLEISFQIAGQSTSSLLLLCILALLHTLPLTLLCSPYRHTELKKTPKFKLQEINQSVPTLNWVAISAAP